MKIQLLAITAAALFAISATSAHARGHGSAPASHGSTITNNSKNALAIGDSSGAGYGVSVTSSGGRAVAGSIFLTNQACDCNFDSITNRSLNAMAVGNAVAGSVQISTR